MRKTPAEIAEEIRQIVPHLPLILGVDGPGASGKSTLASELGRVLALTVVHTDDFYKTSTQRAALQTPLAAGAAFDLERLEDQVLTPTSGGTHLIRFQKYDWNSDQLGAWVEADVANGVIVEGVYSSELRLRTHYNLRLFVNASASTRLARGLERDGEAARIQWTDEWMPAEDRYVALQRPDLAAHLVLSGEADESGGLTFAVEAQRQGPLAER